MGLFSRKEKPKPQANGTTAQPTLHSMESHTSFRSNGSASLKSPTNTVYSNRSGMMNGNSSGHLDHRVSASTAQTSMPNTPMSPYFTSPASSGMLPPKGASTIPLPKGPDPDLDPAGYLRSLGAVRERANVITAKAARNELRHFDVDMSQFRDVVQFVARIIKRDYDAPLTTSIPSHGKYQHFSAGGRDRIAQMVQSWEGVEVTEKCRRVIDLSMVAVLLDAGAGSTWQYKSIENGRIYRRSEGLAIASLEMFKMGTFSGNPRNKFQVDSLGMSRLTAEMVAKGLQSRPGNEIPGLAGRTQLLLRLAGALDQRTDFFGEDGRPGKMLDFLLAHPNTQASSTPIVTVPTLWDVLMTGLAPIWPNTRTAINGISLGDAWPCSSMPQSHTNGSSSSSPIDGARSPTFSPFPPSSNRSSGGSGGRHGPAAWEAILPFHGMVQWMTYSLMQPMTQLMSIHFVGTELLTGLPEHRNGGLFIDLGVLTLKQAEMYRGLANYAEYCRKTGTKGMEVSPMFETGDDVVVEWRGVTVGLLDRLRDELNRVLAKELQGGELALGQILEAGSWKGGREMAEVSRPNTKQPPILIDSDGTVF